MRHEKRAKFGNRLFAIVIVSLVLVLGVLAQNSNVSEGNESISTLPPEEGNVVQDAVNGGTTTATEEKEIDIKDMIKKDYIKKFVEEEEILEEDINSIQQIDLANPPDDVKLGKEIEDTNIAIYQVDYNKENESKKLFVVTYSAEEFKVPLELKPATAIEYLNFGESEIVDGSEYLKSATGVQTSKDNGYVMMDYGSITGLSTSLEVIQTSGGVVEIIVYVNGEDAGLRNAIYSPEIGINKDYDKQSKDVVKFQPGDVISVYVKVSGEIKWKDAINLVKIQLDE